MAKKTEEISPEELALPLSKLIIPSKSKKKTINPSPSPSPVLASCHRCKSPSSGLEILESEWRVVLLCQRCLRLVLDADACSYCFLRLSEDEDIFLNCLRCFRRVHYYCIPAHPYYVLASQVVAESFYCMDCCPAPKSSSAAHADGHPLWVGCRTKFALKRPRNPRPPAVRDTLLGVGSFGRELAIDGGSTRTSSDRQQVVSHVSSDKWEWVKNGTHLVKGSRYPRHYYRCSRFSEGCIAWKQVDRSETSPGVTVFTYIAKHNHVDGHLEPAMDPIGKRKAEKQTKGCSSDAPRSAHTLIYGQNRNEIASFPYSVVAGVEHTGRMSRKLDLHAGQTPPPSTLRNQQNKEACHIPTDGVVTADQWAWHQYGKTPVNNSLYPRTYYKCSSYEGCKARKRVEQCGTDPQIIVVTYKDQHDHNICNKPCSSQKS